MDQAIRFQPRHGLARLPTANPASRRDCFITPDRFAGLAIDGSQYVPEHGKVTISQPIPLSLQTRVARDQRKGTIHYRCLLLE
jgi:hypothetical protein